MGNVTPREYEVAFFAQTVWRLAHSSDENELMAVACAVRNLVIPRPGTVPIYASFSEACEDCLRIYPTRPRPVLTDIAFVSPNGLLAQINDVYDGTYPDVTATQNHLAGARYFSRVANLPDDDWFKQAIVNNAKHPLLGSWGSMQFYG